MTDLTYSAICTVETQDQADRLAAACENLIPEPTGVGTFEIEDGSGLYEVTCYFTEKPDEAGLALLTAMHATREFIVSEVPQIDWVSHVRRELAPVEAGRFFVYGGHDKDKLPADKIGLLIEAAMAFGTGHHGTTLGCLRAVDRIADAGFAAGKTADIGCGTAVLAMAAKKIWPDSFVLASDIDRVAVDVAEANLTANNMGGEITCVESAGFDADAVREHAPYDLIFANILKGPLIELSPDMAANLRSGGRAILSGLLNEQAEEIIGVYNQNGFTLENHEIIGEWSTLTLVRG